MSSTPFDPAGNQDALHVSNPGAVLREARLTQGLSETDVATSLRLSLKTLGFIESGQFDRLPGDTFGRGYIRAYARLLKLDASRLVIDYDRQMGIEVRERPVHGISQIAPYAQSRSGHIWLRASTAAVLAAVFASALWWWNDNRMVIPEPVVRNGEALLEEVQIDSLPLPVPLPGLRLADMQLGEEATPSLVDYSGAEIERLRAVQSEPDTTEAVSLAGDGTPVPQSAEAMASAADDVARVAAPSEPSESTAPAATVDGLSMTFKDSCWVQVSTAEGRVLHSALMQAGQSLNISQDGPLQLIIGAIEAVASLEYRGGEVAVPSNRNSGVVRLRLGQQEG